MCKEKGDDPLLPLTFLFGIPTFVSDEDELLGETLLRLEAAPTEGAMAKFSCCIFSFAREWSLIKILMTYAKGVWYAENRSFKRLPLLHQFQYFSFYLMRLNFSMPAAKNMQPLYLSCLWVWSLPILFDGIVFTSNTGLMECIRLPSIDFTSPRQDTVFLRYKTSIAFDWLHLLCEKFHRRSIRSVVEKVRRSAIFP